MENYFYYMELMKRLNEKFSLLCLFTVGIQYFNSYCIFLVETVHEIMGYVFFFFYYENRHGTKER
jgi:hypothetical protein